MSDILNKKGTIVISLLGAGVFVIAAFFVVPTLFSYEYAPVEAVKDAVSETVKESFKPQVKHMSTPKAVRAIYMTQCAAATPSFRERLTSLIESTELNSIIIDIKDYTGTVAFSREGKENGGGGCMVEDMKELVEYFHDRDIYVIGRVTVFQDPYRANAHPEWAVLRASDGAVWRDDKGLSFIDVSARPYWDWVVELTKDSYALGFDEINFDYIRFPSDGNLRDITFPHSGDRPKYRALEDFFEYLSSELEDVGVVTSADLFGMTATAQDDMNIGQILERALPYFDYIAPMVYPSHYPAGYNGYGNPNHNPYGVIYHALSSAVERAIATSTRFDVKGAVQLPTSTSTPQVRYAKPAFDKDVIRPWLQDFDYGGDYGPEEVRAQIQATYDVGLDSWMLWDPANRYTPEALESS